MAQEDVVIRFNQVSFAYHDKKVILDEANFSVRRNSIITIIGQNGAGKSTIFKLLLGKLMPQSGKISLALGTTIGIAEQMIPAISLELNILDYFKTALPDKQYGIEGDIKKYWLLSISKFHIQKGQRTLRWPKGKTTFGLCIDFKSRCSASR